MKAISTQTQNKLISVVEKTATAVSSGESPNEAIIKLAKENTLRRGEIDLVVRAFNIGFTNRQRQTGTDAFDKSASFELADADVIKEAIFPGKVASADFRRKPPVAQTETIHTDYLMPSAVFEKAAARKEAGYTIPDISVPATPSYPVYEEGEARKTRQRARWWVNAFDALQKEAAAATEERNQAYLVLCDQFQALDAPTIQQVKRAAAVLYNEIGVKVLDAIEPLLPKLTKRASADNIHLDHPVVTAVGTLIEKMAKQHEAKTTWANCLEGLRVMQKIATATLDSTTSAIPFYVEKEASEKQAIGVNPLTMAGAYGLLEGLGRQTSQAITGLDDNDAIGSAVSRIGSDSHENNLRRIAVQANLQNLLTTDPYISGHSSKDVASAFNSLSQLAPSAADRESVMRVALRNQLSQEGMGMFDQTSLVDLDRKLAPRTAPTPG